MDSDLPPHKRANMLRTALKGVITLEQAQQKAGDKVRVLEVRPAQCVGDDGVSIVDATEVIYELVDN